MELSFLFNTHWLTRKKLKKEEVTNVCLGPNYDRKSQLAGTRTELLNQRVNYIKRELTCSRKGLPLEVANNTFVHRRTHVSCTASALTLNSYVHCSVQPLP